MVGHVSVYLYSLSMQLKDLLEIIEWANEVVKCVEQEMEKYKEGITEEEERIKSEDTEKVLHCSLNVRSLSLFGRN